MPYGMYGGDTPESDKWMERCVAAVKLKGEDESSAVRICKAAYAKKQATGGKP